MLEQLVKCVAVINEKDKKAEDKTRLTESNCKTTKNESRLTGLQNSKNKTSEPAIVTASFKATNRFRINIY